MVMVMVLYIKGHFYVHTVSSNRQYVAHLGQALTIIIIIIT